MAAFSLALCAVYSVFLVMGGFAFMYLEFEMEESIIMIEEDKWKNLKEILSNPNLSDGDEGATDITNLVQWLRERCPKLSDKTFLLIKTPGNKSHVATDITRECPGVLVEVTEIKYHYPWNFVDALYFAMTVATTIGYGHISPSTPLGRIVCMIYAIFGIPLTMILLSWTSNFFGERLFLLFEARLDKEKRVSKFFIALGTIFYISVGFVIFIFLPAIIFMKIENWTYLEGVYYAFITLTTIGFGDFVSAKSMDGYWMYIYQIAVILWIMSGLGYWVMVANFMTRALRSKKMQTFARKATDIRKLMNQVGLTNPDPKFLSQHSKTTINFMLQLSNALVMPEISHNDEAPSSMRAFQTPPAIPGIASLFGQSGLSGMMASMASTTGRACQQSEALIKTEESTSSPDYIQEVSDIQERLSKIIDSKSLKIQTIDVDIEKSVIGSSNPVFKPNETKPLKVKTRREPTSGIISTPSANNLLSGSSSAGHEDIDEVLTKETNNSENVVDSSGFEAGIENDFNPTSTACEHSTPNIYNIYNDSEVWEDYDFFSIRL